MEVFVALGAAGLWLVFDGSTRPSVAGPRVRDRIDRLLDEAGIGISPRTFLSLCAGTGGLAILGMAAFSSSALVAFVFGLAGAYAPVARARSRRAIRRRRHREAWPDALAALIAAVRSGGSIGASCVDLADRAPESLRPAWEEFRATYRATGGFPRAVTAMTQVAADPIADRVGAVLRTVHEVGGAELVPVLQALAGSIRAELRLIREVEARWSWTVTAARVAAAAPWVVLVLMSTRPEAAAAYASQDGAYVLLGGAAATLVGYRGMLRAARLPQERRLER
ncbi:MAG: type II secretion system protein F [Actinobacteria bacterium]|nr:type II secretion system protein F [Actinomycetota bacterium]